MRGCLGSPANLCSYGVFTLRNVIEYLETNAEFIPDKIAVAYRDDRYSFRELMLTARCLASSIPTGMKNQPVGVFTDRSADAVMLCLAVLYSGNYYIPIDPELPAKKLQAILDDAKPRILLGSAQVEAVLDTVTFDGVYLTRSAATDNPCPLPDTGGDDPLYMIYTSGSTGKPKGVLKSHSAEISFLEAYCRTFEFGPDEIIGNQTPFFFDAAGKDLYLMLKTGATLEIIPTELFAMPPMLVEYLNERRITFISWVPTALSIVAQLRTFSFVLPETLKKVFFVGEVMPMKHLNYWRRMLPELRYVNLYGSTEIAGICAWYEVSGTYDDADSLPMGKPLCNCEIFLLDGDQTVAEPDRVGELYLVSPALALEYYNDPEKTEASFQMRDFGNGPVRCFKTGDLARYDSEGNLVFAARTDYQIKHMGHRIELGEIETVAGALPGVERCCCLYDTKKGRIVLFCQTAADAQTLTGKEIRQMLRPRLSAYMLPAKVHLLPEMPLNANGKIDRQRLREALS